MRAQSINTQCQPQDATPTLGPTLPQERTSGELLHALRARVRESLEIKLTENRRTYLSFRRKATGGIHLRLHRHFLKANDDILDSVATLLGSPGDRYARQALKGFWMAQPTSPPAPRAPRKTTPQGKTYDLQIILNALAPHLQRQEALPTIGWGRRSNQRARRRSIRLGSYDFERAHITIHRALDEATVPEFVVRQVVFHELLHHDMGIELRGGRRILHSKAFRQREAASPDYLDSERWISRNLPQLLRY